jgi:hypothetical protein
LQSDALHTWTSILNYILWCTSLRRDRKELVEHVLRIVLRFELLQALVVHTKHVFGLLFVLYDVSALVLCCLPKLLMKNASGCRVYTYGHSSIYHLSASATPLPNPSIHALAHLRSTSLKFRLEYLGNIPRPLATDHVVGRIVPQRRKRDVEVASTVRRSNGRVRHPDDLCRIQQLKHELGTLGIWHFVGKLGVRFENGDDELGTDG